MDLFPDFSDVSNVSQETRRSWEGEYSIRAKYRQYFTGDVFNKKLPAGDGSEEDVDIYPIGINLVKMLCQAQADSLFGEWQEDIITFQPDRDGDAKQAELEASKLAQRILRNSSANSMLWELALDREIYGGCALKIAPSFQNPIGNSVPVRWTRVPLDSFYPVWDPEDIDRLLEVYVVYEITREQAMARYGYQTSKDSVKRVEHWTLDSYENTIDGKVMSAYSGYNPWGVIPFEFIPRLRTTHWWGDSLTEDLIRVQDELNMRIADLGEAINYNSHPTRWGYNLNRAFNSQNYPLGPNIFWDLGKVIGDKGLAPTVGILEAKNPVPKEAFDYIRFLYDWARVSSSAPPVVFGEDSDGSQRSGITLELRMWPLIKATRRSRAYFGDGLKRAMRTSARILQQKQITGIGIRALTALTENLQPDFAPVMPRDQVALVDEVVKRMSTTPPTISLETAVKKLGDGIAEVERVEKMVKSDMYKDLSQPPMQMGPDGKPASNKKKPAGTDSAAGSAPKE